LHLSVTTFGAPDSTVAWFLLPSYGLNFCRLAFCAIPNFNRAVEMVGSTFILIVCVGGIIVIAALAILIAILLTQRD
jgi:hypothetical protein